MAATILDETLFQKTKLPVELIEEMMDYIPNQCIFLVERITTPDRPGRIYRRTGIFFSRTEVCRYFSNNTNYDRISNIRNFRNRFRYELLFSIMSDGLRRREDQMEKIVDKEIAQHEYAKTKLNHVAGTIRRRLKRLRYSHDTDPEDDETHSWYMTKHTEPDRSTAWTITLEGPSEDDNIGIGGFGKHFMSRWGWANH